MINYYRVLPDEIITSNSVYTTMKLCMRRFCWTQWTIGEHQRLVPRGWDNSRLDVSDFKTECQDAPMGHGQIAGKKGVGVQSVAFRDLAKHVKNYPTGYDALDLTRMVQFAVLDSTEAWEFPGDYAKLLAKIGGPAPVKNENWDFYVLERWNTVNGPHMKKYDKSKWNLKKRKGVQTCGNSSLAATTLNAPSANHVIDLNAGSDADAEGETDTELDYSRFITQNFVENNEDKHVDDFSVQAALHPSFANTSNEHEIYVNMNNQDEDNSGLSSLNTEILEELAAEANGMSTMSEITTNNIIMPNRASISAFSSVGGSIVEGFVDEMEDILPSKSL